MQDLMDTARVMTGVGTIMLHHNEQGYTRLNGKASNMLEATLIEKMRGRYDPKDKNDSTGAELLDSMS